MLYEILIILSAATIFIVIVRRLPETDDGFLRPSTPMTTIAPKASRLSKLISRAKSRFRFRMPHISKVTLPNFNVKREKKQDDWLSGPPLKSVEEIIADADFKLSQHNLSGAEQLYVKAAARMPTNAKIYSRLGIIYLQQKNFADARDAFLAAIHIDSTVASRHFNLGLAYQGMHSLEKARVSYKKAVELEPKNEKYLLVLKEIGQRK